MEASWSRQLRERPTFATRSTDSRQRTVACAKYCDRKGKNMKGCFDPEQFQSLSKKILKKTKEAGADEAAVRIHAHDTGFARFSRNQIIENSQGSNTSIELAVSLDGHEAVVTSDNIDEGNFEMLARKAVELARVFPKNPEHQSPVPPVELPVINSFDEQTYLISHKEKAETIREICRKASSKNLISYGTLSTGRYLKSILNSAGLFAFYPETKAEFSITVRTADQSGSYREATSSHRLSELKIEELSESTMHWAEKSRNPATISPGDYDVILKPTAAMNYLGLSSGFWMPG
jgi:predicted Zn-dependent protease